MSDSRNPVGAGDRTVDPATDTLVSATTSFNFAVAVVTE